MYQAVYPTCLVNYMKTLLLVGLKFSLFGSSFTSGLVSESNFDNTVPDYKFKRIGYN